MDGAIHYEAEPERQLIRTGPIELRDRGPNGRPLGTPADCEDDDSPWELHRGELVETPMSHNAHATVIGIISNLFGTHARDEYSNKVDVHCVLDDAFGESRRAPDVVLIRELKLPDVDGPLRGVPILAVEVRATQAKKYLEEKVKLYLEHDWPTVWIVHTERHEVEIVQHGLAPVVYRPGANVPLVPELDKYGLSSLPVNAFFDKLEASKYIDRWAEAQGHQRGIATSLLAVLEARGIRITAAVRKRIDACNDVNALQRWLLLAATATNLDAFVEGMG
ncbi:MAG TPA: Uma2 family endonuclease [Polyangium sp.]|nr:Uma2 family endonuclease [Polyangium sp.]